MKHLRTTHSTLRLLVLITALPASSQAELLVYEGFQYDLVGDSLNGQPDLTQGDIDATGLIDTWSEALPNSEMFLKSESLTFSDLATTGNHVGYLSNANNDIFNRAFSNSVTDTIATTGTNNGTIYFSYLFEKLQNNFGAAHEGFAIMNGVLPSARWDSGNPGAIGTNGFAVAAVNGDNLQAIAYDGTAGTQVVGGEFLPITVVNGSANTQTSNQAVSFIVGEISFNTGTNGADVFKLYNATDDGELSADDLTLIDTIEADVDESLLTTLNITRQVNVNYDEIRIGGSLSDVFPAGAGAVELSINSIQKVDKNLFELTLTGSPGPTYEVVSSANLDFPNGSTVTAITQGDPSDPGTISGPNSEIITPDENGNATIQITLGNGAKGFVRAREAS